MYEWSLVAEGGAVSEICVSNRLSGKKKNNNNNNKDSTEIRKTIKDSNVLESFNYGQTTAEYGEIFGKKAHWKFSQVIQGPCNLFNIEHSLS